MNDNLLINDDECPLLSEPLQFNPLELFPSSDDILSLTKQIEYLNIEVNNQGLKTEVERLKRRRLSTNLKQMRQTTMPIQKALALISNAKMSFLKNNLVRRPIYITAVERV